MFKHLKQKLPQEKVIAMAASVAAFGLCGSSQDVVGTEVKSSLLVCFFEIKKKKEREKIRTTNSLGRQTGPVRGEETRPGR